MNTVKQLGSLWYRVDDKGEPVLQPCSVCGRAACFFENVDGRTSCVACGGRVTAKPATPQTAIQTVALLEASMSGRK